MIPTWLAITLVLGGFALGYVVGGSMRDGGRDDEHAARDALNTLNESGALTEFLKTRRRKGEA